MMAEKEAEEEKKRIMAENNRVYHIWLDVYNVQKIHMMIIQIGKKILILKKKKKNQKIVILNKNPDKEWIECDEWRK